MSSKKKKRWHLKRGTLPKNIQWAHDFDYLRHLSEEEQDFLNQFIKEYYDGAPKKDDYDALHVDDASRKECYNDKNRKNRDMMSIFNANGNICRISPGFDQAQTELSEAVIDARREVRKRLTKASQSSGPSCPESSEQELAKNSESDLPKESDDED